VLSLSFLQAVAKTVKETVAPMIKQYKPPQVESIQFEALTLGTLPALIDGQCLCPQTIAVPRYGSLMFDTALWLEKVLAHTEAG
jgi:hypothetical protein